MNCTLKILAGPEAGQEFTCSGPETFLGRSQRCAARLSSPAVSFEHALITRTGDDFFIENLSANGTLINNDRLQARTRLRQRDQIRMGDTVARVERLPAASAAGSSRRVLLAFAVGMSLLVVAAFAGGLFSSPAPQNSQIVNRIMQQYAQDQTALGGLPPDMPDMLAEALRFESAGNRAAASKAWLRIHARLDAWDQSRGLNLETSARGLEQLRSGEKTSLSPEAMPGAFRQYIRQMEQRR